MHEGSKMLVDYMETKHIEWQRLPRRPAMVWDLRMIPFMKLIQGSQIFKSAFRYIQVGYELRNKFQIRIPYSKTN